MPISVTVLCVTRWLLRNVKISITNKIKENYIVALRLRSHRVITQAIDGYRYILQRIITHPHRAAANMAEELFFASLHPMRRTLLVDGWVDGGAVKIHVLLWLIIFYWLGPSASRSRVNWGLPVTLIGEYCDQLWWSSSAPIIIILLLQLKKFVVNTVTPELFLRYLPGSLCVPVRHLEFEPQPVYIYFS